MKNQKLTKLNKKRKKMTKEDFDILKFLQNEGRTNAQIAIYLGLKPSSVPTYERYETWEDYVEYKKALSIRYKQTGSRAKPTTNDFNSTQGNETQTLPYGEPKTVRLTPSSDVLVRIEVKLDVIGKILSDLLELERTKHAERTAYYEKRNSEREKDERTGFFRRNH